MSFAKTVTHAAMALTILSSLAVTVASPTASTAAFLESPVLKTGVDASEQDIIGYCRDNMARFKVPKKVVFGPLAKTSTGKVQKFLLRTMANELDD